MKRILLALTLALGLAVAAAATTATPASSLSEVGNEHWRKATGFGNQPYAIRVFVPATNPIMGAFYDNDSAHNISLVNTMVAKWNAHSDIQMTRTTTACLDNGGNSNPNCFRFWAVSNDYLEDTYGVGVAGVAIPLGDGTHFFNGNQSTSPARILLADDWTGQPAGSEENGACHEAGHMLDLSHWDTNDDGIPDGEGPCAGPSNPNPDATDNAAVDAGFDTCHSDGLNAPAPGTGAGGDGPCFGFSAQSSSEPHRPGKIVEKPVVVTFDEVNG